MYQCCQTPAPTSLFGKSHHFLFYSRWSSCAIAVLSGCQFLILFGRHVPVFSNLILPPTVALVVFPPTVAICFSSCSLILSLALFSVQNQTQQDRITPTAPGLNGEFCFTGHLILYVCLCMFEFVASGDGKLG